AAANQLAVWKFHTDWATPANSTFTGPTTLGTAAFSEACGFSGTCIPQSGGGSLDSLGDRLTHRLAYRNFADGHQSLVVNHSITAGSSVGVRWYELRLDPARNPFRFPECGQTAPVIALKSNGQHPVSRMVTVSGPTQLTLDVSPGTLTTAVDWYWALYYNGTLYWVTSGGVSTTRAPWFSGPPVALSNMTLFNLTLPPASSITSVVFMMNGSTVVSSDYITATRP